MSAAGTCCAVVVLHRPDPAMLATVLAAVAPQVAHLLVVANDGNTPACRLPENGELLLPERNLGLGAAYNVAATWAQQRGATHLLLLDQDSVAAPAMVERLWQALQRSEPVAAAGPLWRDRRTGTEGFFVLLSRFGVRRIRPPAGAIVAVDFLISSGSLIALSAWRRIGPFDERLFIDHVDTDWCLRAGGAGQLLLAVPAARLEHAFGEATVEAAMIGKRRLFVYPPTRTYYLLRNSIVLWRRRGTPWSWRLHDMRRTAALVVLHLLVAPARLERLRFMLRAVRDAMLFEQGGGNAGSAGPAGG